MNLMIQPNQICLIVKLYNNRPELLPDSNGVKQEKQYLDYKVPFHSLQTVDSFFLLFLVKILH